MIVLIGICVLCCIIAFFAGQEKSRLGLLCAVGVSVIPFVLHFDYGNDYMEYFNLYLDYARYPLGTLIDSGQVRNDEFGWAILNLAFSPLGEYGFFIIVALIGLLQGFVVYQLMSKYVDPQYWVLAMFTYTASMSIYLMSFSAMRQFLAISLTTLGLMVAISGRKTIPSLLVAAGFVALAATFHTAALITMPFILVRFIKINHMKYILAVLMVLAVAVFVMKDAILKMVFQYIMAKMNDEGSLYAVYFKDFSEKEPFHISIGFLLNMIPLGVYIRYLLLAPDRDPVRSKFVILVCVSIGIFLPLSIILVPMVARIGYFFDIFAIVAVPLTYTAFKNKIISWGLIAIFVMNTLLAAYVFFTSPVYAEKFYAFKSLLDYAM